MNFFNIAKFFSSPVIKSFSLPWSTQSNSMSKREALLSYKRYVFTVVSAIAEDVAKIKFQVYKTVGDKRVAQSNNLFLKLIRQPNPDYTKFSFIEMHQTYMGLCGESFWYLVRGEKTRMIKYIVLLRPDMMDVAVDDDTKTNPLGLVTGYVLNRTDGNKIPIKKEDIVHFKTPNPYNPYRGISPIEAAVEFVKTERLTSEFTMNSINNAGRPSGVLNIKGVIDKDEFEQVKSRFRQEYSGTANAGKTMIVNTGSEQGSGVDFVKLGMELGELALRDLKDVSRDDIMIMYRVSKTMLGITDDVNRASAKEAKAVWMENVIKPKMFRLVDGLDGLVSTEYGSEYDLDYEDPAPKYLEDRTAEWTAGHNKWLTTNQIIRERNEFLGTEVDEIEGGDEIYQSIALVPLGTPNPSTQPEPKPKHLHKVKKKGLTRTEFGAVFRSELFTRQERWQKRYKEWLNSILDLQKREILKRNKKAYSEWKFDPKDYKDKYLNLFVSLGVELMKEQAQVALRAAGDSETEFSVDDRILKYINERVELFATDFDKETLAYIETSIGEGYQKGESTGKLRKRIEDIYEEAKTVRSERVARTETIANSNQAALEAYKQSPLVTAMEWTTEDGGCAFCMALNGKVVGLNSNFANVGETISAADDKGNPLSYIVDYTDISHPPLHPNCKCSILPVVK